MAKKVKQAHGGAINRFEKGDVGNPYGRPPKLVTHVNKQLRERGIDPVTKTQVQDCYMLLMNLTMMEIQHIAEPDSDYPFLYKLVAKELIGKRGAEMLERMLDRGIGKPTQHLDHTTNDKPITEINYIVHGKHTHQ